MNAVGGRHRLGLGIGLALGFAVCPAFGQEEPVTEIPQQEEEEEAEEAPPGEEGSEAADALPPGEDPNIVLSYDGWFIRLDAGVAYTHTVTTYHLTSDDSDETTLESDGLGPSVDLAVAARLGRDVTLGGLGQLAHSPATHRDGGWDSKSQGLYYAAVFVDHRLPWSIVHLGGGAGAGYVYASGPNDESIGGVSPIGTAWLGLDFPATSRVAVGLVLDFVGGAMTDTENVDGVKNDFKTFIFAVGLSFTLRISEPSWPDSFPSLARL